MAENRQLKLSLVIPVFNEQDCLHQLYNEIKQVLSDKYDHEILFVDDGSTDDSYKIIKGFRENDKNVRVIKFRNNFGQTAAFAAGFKHSKGDIIIPLDADCQNDPADIPRLVDKLSEGYDIVSGWRKNRQDTFITRTLPSRIANWCISKITGVQLHDYGCSLKAYKAESLREIRLYGEMHRFIPALASWGGEKVTEIAVNHRPRTTGTTKYGLNRTFKVILDLITIKFLASFSTKPIYVFGGLGGVCFIGSFLSGILVIYQKLVSDLNINRNGMFYLAGLLFTASIQFVMMGLLAEIMVRTYHESQDRPIYVIQEILEDKPADQHD